MIQLKLPALVTATSNWLGIERSVVEACARSLRSEKKISTGGVGGGAVAMTDDDAITLLLAVCGCGTARTAGKHVDVWKELRPLEGIDTSIQFAFRREVDFRDALLSFIRYDLKRGGAVDQFVAQAKEDAARFAYPEMNTEISVEFEIDNYDAAISVETAFANEIGRIDHRRRVVTNYANFLNFDDPQTWPTRDHGQRYLAASKLVRVLNERNLRGFRAQVLGLID